MILFSKHRAILAIFVKINPTGIILLKKNKKTKVANLFYRSAARTQSWRYKGQDKYK